MNFEQWNGFTEGEWQEKINVRDFIDKNYTPYSGDGSFLKGPTERTKKALAELERLKKLEQEKGGVLSINTTTVSSLCNYQPGYLTDSDLIVGLQTEAPLTRGVNPFGGIRMARSACEAYGYKLGEQIEEYFTYRTTHNDGVFRVYTDEASAEQLKSVAEKYNCVTKTELQPFRKLCLEKYQALGIPFPLADTPEADEKTMEKLNKIINGTA